MNSKTFAVVESVDNPKGAMLLRYQTVERIEPDPEEARMATSAYEEQLARMPADVREEFEVQMAAAKAAHGIGLQKMSYRIELKMVLCRTVEEIASGILEAKEANDEIARLTRTGARFEMQPTRLSAF